MIDVTMLSQKGSKILVIVGMNCIFIYLFNHFSGAGIISRFITPFSKLLFARGGDITMAVITVFAAWAALWYI